MNVTATPLFAHYFASRKVATLILSPTPSLRGRHEDGSDVVEISVAGKAEARKIAAERGATPWNF